ncbi:unnamed protein product [Schistocephalus solidus]|uniref:BHLH domain-containing protein n=2 Tax=Schistocephalus solidus TaxID=70667 RepID=A0A183T1E2_SCHSO|nr:unnamed protein product [Schistocephalus solidus]
MRLFRTDAPGLIAHCRVCLVVKRPRGHYCSPGKVRKMLTGSEAKRCIAACAPLDPPWHLPNSATDGDCQPGTSSRMENFGTGKPFQQHPPSPRPVKRLSKAKERAGTADVKDAFVLLRQLIPTDPTNRKLSKIETLRLATSYIAHLNSVLVTGMSAPEQPCLRLRPPSAFGHTSTFGDDSPSRRRSFCTFCVTEARNSGART